MMSSFRVAAMRCCYKSYKVTKLSLTSLHRLDVAFHIKVLFRNFVMFTFKNFFEPSHRIRNRDVLTFRTCEDFCDLEWLTEKTLNLTCAQHHKFIFGTQFIHAEDCDDVLQILVSLQDSLDATRGTIMIFADDLRGKRFGGRSKRIDSRIDSHFSNRALQPDG